MDSYEEILYTEKFDKKTNVKNELLADKNTFGESVHKNTKFSLKELLSLEQRSKTARFYSREALAAGLLWKNRIRKTWAARRLGGREK